MQHLFDRDFNALTARSALICLWLAGAVVMVPALALPASTRFYLFEGAMLLTSAAVLTLLRRRLAPRVTTGLILAVMAVVTTSATWVTGGPESPALRSYAVAIVGGYWLVLGPTGATIATLVTVATMAVVTWADTQGWLPAPWVVHTPWSLWLTTATSCALLAVMQRLEVHRVRTAFRTAQTELQRSEQAERHAALSERRFAEVVATVPGVVYTFEAGPDGSRRFTFVSEGARHLFGSAPASLMGDAGTIFGMVDPPSQLPELEASIAHSYATLEPWEFYGTIRAVDGTSKWIRGHSLPTRQPDGTVRWHGVLTDISARRSAEEALRESKAALRRSLSLLQSAFDSTADGLLVVALDGRVTGYNEKFVSLWRMPKAVLDTNDDQALLSHAVNQLAEPEAFLASVRSLYERPGAVSFDTLRLADGRCFERYSQPQSLDGEVVGRVWSFRDVTARLDEEQRRAELEHQLQHAHTLEALGTLSGGIAHDFNNLLMVIMGHAEASAGEADETVRQQGLETITEASLRASALVRQIREFSQPRPTARMVLAASDTIGSALQLLRTTMPKSIELVVTLTPHVTMFANATQVQQVVMNLAVNAAQAIGDAAGRIEVTLDEIHASEAPDTVPAPAAERYARLSVRDTGRGIAADVLPRIFDPFFTTKTASPGSGLGLAVVQGIVRRHAGLIEVDSTPGEGTAVHVYWPALAPAAIEPQPPASVPVAAAPPGHGQHVLVVDDEPEVAKIVGQSLRMMGYRVTVATDPRQALSTFLANPAAIDAVLTDLSMPHLSGIELGRRILERRPDTPVVIFTGYNADFGPDEARAIGIRAVLNKPMTSAILAEALHRALTTSVDPRDAL
jgi:signal transduction histidine kinase/ActR/RegA family two-component response regulator